MTEAAPGAPLPRLMDSRRLTGANLCWERTSAVIDLACAGDPAGFIAAWEAAARALLAGTGHAGEQLAHRVFDGGASLLISAPVDALYAMCELNEVAFGEALAALGGPSAPARAAELARLQALFAAEANPPLLALQAAAAAHGVPFLWDDQLVSLGHGAAAQAWAPRALPAPAEVDWSARTGVPVALVTGTNGKSTTVRMAAAILAAAGLRAGLTSTDWIRVDGAILDRGDYSGTGGARTLLRHPGTGVAVLETARGGLLRRGLAVDRATVALITNVAADHLGDYGIHTVPELVEAKFIVRRALRGGAPLILNADDAGIVAFATGIGAGANAMRSGSDPGSGGDFSVQWFSLDPRNEVLAGHRTGGGRAAFLRAGQLVLAEGGAERAVVGVEEIPATLLGAARHNVQNALGALLLCQALGIADEHLAAGLRGFRGDADDNPGRANVFEANGVRILVDFAHNVHGMRALVDLALALPARRRVLLMSQAGDRTDAVIREMVRIGLELRPHRLLCCDLPGYERGRQAGEISRLIHGFALELGLGADRIACFADPVGAAASALAAAQPGDLLVLLALSQRESVLQMISDFVAVGAREQRA